MNQPQMMRLTSIGLVSILLLGTLSKGAGGQTSIAQATLRNSLLSKHNTYRNAHRSSAMTLNDSLNSTAQSWAKQIARTGVLAHSSSRQRNGAGENLYVFYTTAGSIATDALANSAIKTWYDEVAKYNYTNPGFATTTGHFTQVVWKSSTQLGCGAAQGTKTLQGKQHQAFYVVCHYAPAGNVTGQFPANVLKP
ncbi:CAP family protein [Microcoleus vaginatus]|uniref:CAP family protein n=1 Tax=Microcoleus vaginatus TaxID=119532 RepID=UPI0032A50009